MVHYSIISFRKNVIDNIPKDLQDILTQKLETAISETHKFIKQNFGNKASSTHFDNGGKRLVVNAQKTPIYSEFDLLFYFSYVSFTSINPGKIQYISDIPLLRSYSDIGFRSSIRFVVFICVRNFQSLSFLMFCMVFVAGLLDKE